MVLPATFWLWSMNTFPARRGMSHSIVVSSGLAFANSRPTVSTNFRTRANE